jgi:hypothetical protein
LLEWEKNPQLLSLTHSVFLFFFYKEATLSLAVIMSSAPALQVAAIASSKHLRQHFVLSLKLNEIDSILHSKVIHLREFFFLIIF